MIPDYSVRGTMFKGFNKTRIFSDSISGKERQSIFGNDIPQVAKAKNDPRSSSCCVIQLIGNMSVERFTMNGFYSTIWKRNLRNVLITNSAFGESCCTAKL